MKLLVILPRFPYPTEKGDKLRAFNQIKVLSRFHDITLFALTDKAVKRSDEEIVKPYCSSIIIHRLRPFSIGLNLLRAMINGRPFQAGYYYNSRAQSALNKVIEETQPDHIYCQLLRTAAYAFNTDVPKTLDYQDVFSKGVERRIPKTRAIIRFIFRVEFRRLLKYEKRIFDVFDVKTIISKPDRDCIPHEKREEIHVIPNGVDQEYFKPYKTKKQTELLFTGNMGYPPNIDCAEYLVNKVLPIIHSKYPDARLTIAGATPHSRVKALENDKVIVTGWVDDIREYYAGARIFMAPMQLGTGLQNKLLEAMAMRLPCITSSLCNSALMAREGEEILIGNTPEEVAEQAIKLLSDTSLADNISTNGYTFIQNNYSWAGSTVHLSELMEQVSEKKTMSF
jgi:sugar transferase (PEP-CTERM/EpsH1 system associated)